MYIIPAIDILDGKCVRLTEGDYQRLTVYHDDPLEVARSFEDAGIEKLHLVDLDGAKSKRIINWKTLERIATHTRLQIDFGGGIKSNEDVRIAFENGASQITGGTVAAKDPELFLSWLKQYGPDKIILGADARDGKIAVSGWQEESDQDILPFIASYFEKGIGFVISTDIRKDGRLEGPSIDLYQEILTEIPELRLIASGGVATMDDLEELESIQCFGAIVGKALYEGKISLKELEHFNA